MHAFHRRAAVLCSALALASAAAPAAHATPIHQVAAGESLWSVAAANGMSPAQLAAANGLSAGAYVRAGQVLSIPPRTASAAPTAAAPATTTATAAAPAATSGASAGGYVVQPGDSLSAIAARQGITVTHLAAANGLNASALLPAGARLALPAGGSSPATSSGATTRPAAATSSTTGTTTTSTTTSTTSATPVATPGRVNAEQIGAIATQNGVPPALARAIAWQESGFNNAAVSNVGARGVMQVMPGTWRWIGSNLAGRPLDPSSPTDNVQAGTLYLRHLLRETGGDQSLAAAGYYQGLASVRGRGMYDDTKQYVNSVAALRARFGG